MNLPGSSGGTVSQWVQDLVAVGLWLPLLGAIWGALFGLAILAVRFALSVDPSEIGGAIGSPVAPEVGGGFVLLAVFGVLGAIYYLNARVTFGGETVDDAQESGAELVEDVQEASE